MASGRRDYTWGSLQDIVQPGLSSSSYSHYWQEVIGAGLTVLMAIYIVEEGYKFYLFAVLVTCKQPGINRMMIYDSPELLAEINFDIAYTFSPGQWGSYAMDAGNILNVYVTNRDSVPVEFTVHLFGVVEKLV